VYSQTTDQVKVSVIPLYLEEHSFPREGVFVWAYTVQVDNMREEVVQLKSRRWTITDAEGQVQEVQGEGVVGEQPMIMPGQGYRYTSGTALQTPSGIMRGEYFMLDGEGKEFQVVIPPFSLDSPYQRKN